MKTSMKVALAVSAAAVLVPSIPSFAATRKALYVAQMSGEQVTVRNLGKEGDRSNLTGKLIEQSHGETKVVANLFLSDLAARGETVTVRGTARVAGNEAGLQSFVAVAGRLHGDLPGRYLADLTQAKVFGRQGLGLTVSKKAVGNDALVVRMGVDGEATPEKTFALPLKKSMIGTRY